MTLFVAACCRGPSPALVINPDRDKGLPQDPVALVRLADKLLAQRPLTARRADRALAALEKAQPRHPDAFTAYWKLARACFELTGKLPFKQQRLPYARRGRDYAGRAATLRPRRVEPHYYRALNISRVAEATANRKLIKAMVAEAAIAAKIDPRFDSAGPYRFLGKVHITAPAWPVSVGSSEKGVEYLEQAVKIAPTPLNRLFLGQAYYHDEEYDEAAKVIGEALRDGKAAGMEAQWLREGKEYLERIKLEGFPTSQRRRAPGGLLALAVSR